ncbi:Mor transcription activator family protein [Brevibacillus thermoruber]|uniref:Mor transcription activator family protein n=1 Tax=Brevibacillus thermoruber TaxID=33942 RepID=UPI0006924C28|nr:Mor transcription activator family protein [Brevibacillus thermoruber]
MGLAQAKEEVKLDDWMSEVTLNELSSTALEIAEIIGIEPTLKLIKRFGGDMLYLPKEETIFRSIRDKRIKAEFNGSNYKELAQKYKITVAWVREILADTPHPDQMSIFDVQE